MKAKFEEQKNKPAVDEEKYFEKKSLNMKSMIIGFLLLVVAALLVLFRRDGIEVFKGKATSPDGIMRESVLSFLEDNNGSFVDLLMFFGENEEDDESLISRTLDLAYDSGESLSFKLRLSKDGELLLDDFKLGQINFSLRDIDFSGFNDSGAVKRKALKSLLSKYEKLFIGELSESCTGMTDGCMNKIDEILLYERRISFDITEKKLNEAYDVVFSEAKKDKKLKSAFEQVYVGNKNYEEWLDGRLIAIRERNMSLKGDIYVDSTGTLTMADFEVYYQQEGKIQNLFIRAGYALIVGKTEYVVKISHNGEKLFEVSGKGDYDAKAQKLSVEGKLLRTGMSELFYSLDRVYRVNDRFLFGGNVVFETGDLEKNGMRGILSAKLAHRDLVQSFIFRYGSQEIGNDEPVIITGVLTVR